MRLISSFFTLFFTLSLVGCFGNDTVTFNPKEGESRHYRTIQSLELSAPGRGSEDIYASSYDTFEVTNYQSNKIHMHISPGKLDAKIGSREFSTSVPGDFPAESLSNLAQGADMVIDSETGEMIDVTAGGSSLRDKLSNMLGIGVDNLLKQASQPSISVPITPKEGWTESKTFRGVPDVQFNVTKVSENKVWVAFNGGEATNQLAGVAVLERESGWIEHLVVTLNSRQPLAGNEVRIRSTEVITQVIDGKEAYVPRMRFEWANRWIDIPGSTPKSTIEAATDLSRIFSQVNGRVKQDEDTLSLELHHAVDKRKLLGTIEISDAQIFDENGELIKQPTHIGPTYSYNQYRDEGKTSTADLSFIGAGDQVQFTENAASVRAKVAWYPDASFIVDLTPDEDNKAHYEGQGVKINFRPANTKTNRQPQQHGDASDDTYVYELTFEGQEKDNLTFQLGNEQAYDVQYHAYPEAPQWLTAEESNLRYQASAHMEAHRVLIRTSEPPSRINLIVKRAEKEAMEIRELVFLTDKAKRFNPNVKPKTSFLYEQNTPFIEIENLKPEGIKRGQVELIVGDMQIKSCSATLSPAAKEAGIPLVFKPVLNKGSFNKPASLLLQTEDGIRTYFYGLGTREITLSCTRKATWVDTNITLSEDTPWVVSIDELSMSNEVETVGDILSRYRFLDAKGRALSLVARGEDVDIAPDTPIEAITFPNNTMHIAGKLASIQYIKMIESPISRHFNVSLPSLPLGSEE